MQWVDPMLIYQVVWRVQRAEAWPERRHAATHITIEPKVRVMSMSIFDALTLQNHMLQCGEYQR